MIPPEFEPFNTFTQDNVLNEKTEEVLPQAMLMRQGMTLDQIGRLLYLSKTIDKSDDLVDKRFSPSELIQLKQEL